MDESSSSCQDEITRAHHAEFRRVPRAGRTAKRKAASAAAIAVSAAAVLWLAGPASASPAVSTARTVNDSIQLMTNVRDIQQSWRHRMGQRVHRRRRLPLG